MPYEPGSVNAQAELGPKISQTCNYFANLQLAFPLLKFVVTACTSLSAERLYALGFYSEDHSWAGLISYDRGISGCVQETNQFSAEIIIVHWKRLDSKDPVKYDSGASSKAFLNFPSIICCCIRSLQWCWLSLFLFLFKFWLSAVHTPVPNSLINRRWVKVVLAGMPQMTAPGTQPLNSRVSSSKINLYKFLQQDFRIYSESCLSHNPSHTRWTHVFQFPEKGTIMGGGRLQDSRTGSDLWRWWWWVTTVELSIRPLTGVPRLGCALR